VGSLVVFLFGILGGLLRFLIGDIFPAVNGFPIATLLVNWLGCFAITFLSKQRFVEKNTRRYLILGISTGFIGSFTTFSSFVLDFSRLLLAGSLAMMFIYIFASLLGGLVLGFLGLKIGGKVARS